MRRTPPFWMIFFIIQNGVLLHPSPSTACCGWAKLAVLADGAALAGSGIWKQRS